VSDPPQAALRPNPWGSSRSAGAVFRLSVCLLRLLRKKHDTKTEIIREQTTSGLLTETKNEIKGPENGEDPHCGQVKTNKAAMSLERKALSEAGHFCP
jgi:hypothetical protein